MFTCLRMKLVVFLLSKATCPVYAPSCVLQKRNVLFFFLGRMKRCLFTLASVLWLGSSICLIVKLQCCATCALLALHCSYLSLHALTFYSPSLMSAVFVWEVMMCMFAGSRSSIWWRLCCYKQEQVCTGPLCPAAATE